MKETLTSQTLWEVGGRNAIAIAALSIVYSLISSLMTEVTGNVSIAFLISVLKFILWAGKLGLSIYLMSYFFKRLVTNYENVTNTTVAKFGTIISLLSALLVSAYTLLSFSIISPESVNEIFDAIVASQGPIDSNTMSVLENVKGHFASIMFFSTFIYCFLFGYVLTMFLSRNIPSRNPFEQK